MSNLFFCSFKSFFQSLDMYGSKIELRFQKKNTYNTIFGGTLSLIIILLLGLGIWFFGKELVYRNNPSVITQQRSVTQPKRIDINSSNQIIVIGITNGVSTPFVDPTIYQVKAYTEQLVFYNDTVTGQQLRKVNQIKKEIKICDKSDFAIPEVQEYFYKLNLPKYYCVGQSQDIYMEGDFDASAFSQLIIYAEKCKNSTDSNIICKPSKEIDDVLKVTRIQVFLSDQIVNPNSYDNPFESKGIGLYSATSSSFPKELQLFFTNQYIESDIGIITQDIVSKRSFIFTEMKETTYFSDPNILVRAVFRIQKQKENLMQRRYSKLADVVALTGGLLKILTTFGALISYPFSKFCLNKAIVDQVFNFNYQENNNDKKQQQDRNQQQYQANEDYSQNINKKKQITKTIDVGENNSIIYNNQIHAVKEIRPSKKSQDKIKNIRKKNQSEIKDVNSIAITEVAKRKSIIEVAQNLFLVTKNTIKFKFSDLISHIFLKKFIKPDEKHQLVEKGIQKIINHLDIFFILNKIHEIDKLKALLFNQDQVKLFDFIQKPVISSEDASQNSPDIQINNEQNSRMNTFGILNMKKAYSIFNESKTDEQKAIDAYIGLSMILKKEKRDQIDERLVDLIDPYILDQIKQKEKDKLDQKLNNIPENENVVNYSYNQRISESDHQIDFDQILSNEKLIKKSAQILNDQKAQEQVTFVTSKQQSNTALETGIIKLNNLETIKEEKKIPQNLKCDDEFDTQSMYIAQQTEMQIKFQNNIPNSLISQIENNRFQSIDTNKLEDTSTQNKLKENK